MPDRVDIYKNAGGFDLRLHLFLPPGQGAGGRCPAVVFFFGGGWNGGTPTQFYPHCEYLAGRGMVAAAAEYRVKSVHDATPFDCVADGKSAVRWLRAHAAELGVDPARIAAGGGSAGGQVAAAAGLVKGFDDPADDLAASSRPDALVLFNPVLDNGPGGYGYERVRERWLAFSPLHNIAPGAPPAIVFLGSGDSLVPVSMMLGFKRRMEEAGSRCDVWIYEGQPHGFFNRRGTPSPYFDATVYEADRFLASLGWLEGGPALPAPAVPAAFLAVP